ncbi:glycosyl hydrolase family 28 protein [Aerosakkonemataceae cyanobacterium BLCC-F154]|uniref:Glycosyl hydrolase family 28 protein n=1 Tax=Floridaenema fluviatile BLCC-F154 TaxID=3153640 RepID=A0ABV4Y518_9CYAN
MALILTITIHFASASNLLLFSSNSPVKLAAKSASSSEISPYSVTVNGQPVKVQKYHSLSYVQFDLLGQANVEITLREAVKQYSLSPKSYSIPSKQTGNKIYFSLTNPVKLILHQVNSLEAKLFIFAEAPEENSPKIGGLNVENILDYPGIDNTGSQDVTSIIQTAIDTVSQKSGILYFPPGIYKTQQLNLKSNLTLYLASGAVIEATKDVQPSYGRGVLQIENVHNLKIIGRGVINGNGSYWRPQKGWYTLILIKNSRNILLQDILLKDPAVANVWMSYSENINIYNVKILADPKPKFVNTDGFDFWSSRNIILDNVLYKGTDDATSHGGDKKEQIQNNENINIRNAVFYTGGGFKMGSGAAQKVIRNITYENIDVVYTNTFSGFWPVAGANFEKIYFKNIRVEDIADVPRDWGSAQLFQWHIYPSEADSPPETLGYIRDVYINNLTTDDRGGRKSTFNGYDSQRDIRIAFNNFSVAGQFIKTLEDAPFEIRPSYKDGNQYVSFTFATSDPTIVNIKVPKLYASESGNPGHFNIVRTGNLAESITVKYTIRGTAENGVDYRTIPNFVTIPAGEDSATIVIQPIPDKQTEGLETIFICLENVPNSTKYMLGPDFHAVVNINE